jgi:hypothetical protein
MTNYEYVKKLYKKENELIKISNYCGFFNDDAKDIIQDLYVALLELKNINKYVINEDPNMFIIFAILKNLIYHKRKREQKYSAEELFDFAIIDDAEENEKFEFVINEIEYVNDWFERRILELYIKENHSIRSLSKETKIGIHFIQPIIHKFKEDVKEKYNRKKNQL